MAEDKGRQGPLKCPKCGKPMETVGYSAVEVDQCTGCEGIFFDAGEHEVLRDMPGAEVLDTGDTETAAVHDKVDSIKCPICDVEMSHLVVQQKGRDVGVEQCLACRGFYLDAGEFRLLHEDKGFLASLRELFGG